MGATPLPPNSGGSRCQARSHRGTPAARHRRPGRASATTGPARGPLQTGHPPAAAAYTARGGRGGVRERYVPGEDTGAEPRLAPALPAPRRSGRSLLHGPTLTGACHSLARQTLRPPPRPRAPPPVQRLHAVGSRCKRARLRREPDSNTGSGAWRRARQTYASPRGATEHCPTPLLVGRRSPPPTPAHANGGRLVCQLSRDLGLNRVSSHL